MNCWTCGKPAKKTNCLACEKKRDKRRREVEGIDVIRGRGGKLIIVMGLNKEE